MSQTKEMQLQALKEPISRLDGLHVRTDVFVLQNGLGILGISLMDSTPRKRKSVVDKMIKVVRSLNSDASVQVDYPDFKVAMVMMHGCTPTQGDQS